MQLRDKITSRNSRGNGKIFINSILSRLYLFHRATELVHEHDDHVGSAAVLGGRYKLVTTQSSMCIYRFFDLSIDPEEKINLIDSRHPPIASGQNSFLLERLKSSTSSLGVVSPSIPIMYDLCPASALKSLNNKRKPLFVRDDFEMRYSVENVVRFMNFKYLSDVNNCDTLEDLLRVECVMAEALKLAKIIRLV